MKQQLLFIFLLASSLSFAQAPIAQFANASEKDYAIIDSSTLLDESTSGAAVTWNYMSLSPVGINTDTNVAPTPAEQSDYPGTTEVLVVTTNAMPPTESRLFIRNQAGEISITGATQEALTLNLSNNATLGTFPLSYSFSNSDTVSGTFAGSVDGTNVNGTFTGSFNTEVDGYGTLNLNDFGLGAYSGSVTRLKTVLDISLTVAGIFDIGTVTQTAYYYYDDSDGNLVFRTSTNAFDIDFLGNVFNETLALYEALDRSTLSLANTTLESDLKLFPNPVSSQLNIKIANDNNISAIAVYDMNGRRILDAKNVSSSIDVSQLNSGLYTIKIQTDTAVISKRFIKR
ncbi:T9SS type A sorting domain-containing protein [Psychroserpens sp. XS_ASV72]|uniref:T9SS type A sorting domain-containing protein n=1 Tax=Psychroserpens sp. XS_ASV72 TaxID=3241293 RepID=UPI00351472C5